MIDIEKARTVALDCATKMACEVHKGNELDDIDVGIFIYDFIDFLLLDGKYNIYTQEDASLYFDMRCVALRNAVEAKCAILGDIDAKDEKTHSIYNNPHKLEIIKAAQALLVWLTGPIDN